MRKSVLMAGVFVAGLGNNLTSALAQSAPATVAAPELPLDASVAPFEPAPSPCCTIPALMVVDLEILSTINSKANKIGEKFPFKLAKPIAVDGREIVPAGAMGSGDVVHAAKSRFGGKAGELVIAARYIDHAGIRVPLRSLRAGEGQGKDNTEAAAAVGIAVGILSMFVTGGEVNVPAGTIMNAKISAAMLVPLPQIPSLSPAPEKGSITP